MSFSYVFKIMFRENGIQDEAAPETTTPNGNCLKNSNTEVFVSAMISNFIKLDGKKLNLIRVQFLP